MQGRFYLPMYGRFASPDPGRDQQFEETQSWNIYSYVRNNPVMDVDPNGMWDVPGWAVLKQAVSQWWSGPSRPYQRQDPVNIQTHPGQSEAKYSVTETWDNKKATTTVTTGNSGTVDWTGAQGTHRDTGGFEKSEMVESTYAGGMLTVSTERKTFEGITEGGIGVSDGTAKVGGSMAAIGQGSSTGLKLNLFGYSLNLFKVTAEFSFGSISAEGSGTLSKDKGLGLSGEFALGAGAKLDVNVLGTPVSIVTPPAPPKRF